jgi:deoxyribodipyrimidine photo-lyase
MANKKYQQSLFIFRRDLRTVDNTALRDAHSHSEKVLHVFCCDPRQLKSNPFAGSPSVCFLRNSLLELQSELREQKSDLYFFDGIAPELIARLKKDIQLEAVFLNADYTPFSRMRDTAILEECTKNNIDFNWSHDALLQYPGSVLKADGLPYTVFTPYKKRAAQNEVAAPKAAPSFASNPKQIPDYLAKAPAPSMMAYTHAMPLLKGGRQEGLSLLANIKTKSDYKEQRDIPSVPGTTLLAAHHKFGTISTRETWHRVEKLFGAEHTLISELHWRDFFHQIAWHFPHVFERNFRPEFDKLRWSVHQKNLEAWKNGMTGFPIVDAGMRELVATGHMHNRVRMIVASFLVKDLLINWREGEQFFAQHLMDYDPAVNNGNWQWAASTGCDAQPYFRIFNPWTQQQRFDDKALYCKQWIPEIKDLSAKEIHTLYKAAPIFAKEYPRPIVDHTEARERTLFRFKELR